MDRSPGPSAAGRHSSTVTQVPPAASIAARAAALKAWAWTVSGLEISPLARTLTGTPLRVAEVLGAQRLERDLGAGVEARVEVAQVHGLRVRAERLERHRLLHVRAAQLAHPHVDRHLAALEARAVLGARARAGALVAAAGGLAVPEPWPRPTRLRGLAAAGSRLQVVQADLLGVSSVFLSAALTSRPPPRARDGGRRGSCRAPAACR